MATTLTFGPNGSGLTSVSDNGVIQCASDTPAFSGTLTSMSVQANQYGGTPATLVGFALYDSNGTAGAMSTLLATSSTTSMPPSEAWATSSISYSLIGGHTYYICA